MQYVLPFCLAIVAIAFVLAGLEAHALTASAHQITVLTAQ